MSNTPSDEVLFELIKEHFGLEKRPFDTVIDRKTGKFHDAARYRDFAAAVLAKWGTPQPVVREPLHAVDLMRIVLKIEQEHNFLRGTSNWAVSVGRAIERAHGITQNGGSNAE